MWRMISPRGARRWRLTLERYGSLLATYLGPQCFRVAAMAALLATSIALQLLNPPILRGFVDAVRPTTACSPAARGSSSPTTRARWSESITS